MLNVNFKSARYIPEQMMGHRKLRTRSRRVAIYIPNGTQRRRALAQAESQQ